MEVRGSTRSYRDLHPDGKTLQPLFKPCFHASFLVLRQFINAAFVLVTGSALPHAESALIVLQLMRDKNKRFSCGLSE